MRCEDLRLEQVLLDADEEGPEFREAARHLESCTQCRERLAGLSGADAMLAEACETLRERGESTLDAANASRSIVVAVERLLGDDNSIDCEAVALDFLEPPRHPELLGRIGRYDVERLIGAGGMGVVLKGFDTELHRVVAIKALLPHLATSAAARRRFSREAQAAAAVVHEHVIPIYNVESDDAVPYLVMQFVPGHSLQARVDEHGPLEMKDVLRIARQAAAGLAAAHAQGLVHRDVKPANILLEESVDRVLLSDFGLARTVDDATLTRTGVLAGTPHYMSPEQAGGQGVDPRSDLFGLGSVIYFMCTGHPPFRADSPMAVLNRICHEPHRPVEEVNPDVPVELAELVDELLAKDPDQRLASALKLETRCAALLASLQQGRRLSRRRWMRSLRRNRPLVRKVAIGLAAAVFCMLAGAWLTRLSRSGIPSAPPAAPTERAAASALDVEVPSVAQASAPARPDPLPQPPPDTFDQDRVEIESRLQTFEAGASSAGMQPRDLADGRWASELAELRSLLRRQDAFDLRPQPASSPSETFVPDSRRD